MAEIKLFQLAPYGGLDSVSPFCVKVNWALRYKRLKYEVKNFTNPMDVRKENPRTKVPVLAYDGKNIADSTDIIAFLEKNHPEPRLYPADEATRSRALLMEDWADESLYWHAVYERWMVDEQWEPFSKEVFGVMPSLLQPIIKPIARRQVRGQLRAQGLGRLSIEEQRQKFVAILGWLESNLDGDYFCGSDLSVADLAAPLAGLALPGTPFSSDEIRKRPRLVTWLDRVKSACS
jgi:glutathione S-transferase